MPKYGHHSYWEGRYDKGESNGKETFDWLEDYNSLKSILQKYIKPNDKILITGCGNAKFSEDLYDAGYHNLWNIDYS